MVLNSKYKRMDFSLPVSMWHGKSRAAHSADKPGSEKWLIFYTIDVYSFRSINKPDDKAISECTALLFSIF